MEWSEVTKEMEIAVMSKRAMEAEERERQASLVAKMKASGERLPKFHVDSDRAGVMVGTDECRTVVSNGASEDGSTLVIIDDEGKIDVHDFRYAGIFEGTAFNIYDSDCIADHPVVTLHGCYQAFTAGFVVVFVKVGE